jgi:AcrR family transcriptional regulator
MAGPRSTIRVAVAAVRSKKSPSETQPVWERPQRVKRPEPAPLSRESIVAAALRLADQQGLSAVSLRKVGAELDAGPMRLYGYVATKEELLELMVDAVYGELAAPLTGSWRELLGELAHRVRAASRAHPWFVGLLGGRPHFGPNALTHRESAFAALSATPGFHDIDFVMQVYRTVMSYVIGALQSEANELRAERETGLDQDAWQAAMWPYLQRTLATGRYPTIARIVHEATHPSADVTFARGLELVLDGIEQGLARAAAQPRQT